jgi:hypothetical protein
MTRDRVARALRMLVVLCATVVLVCPAPAAAPTPPPPSQASNKVEFDVPPNVRVRIVASWNDTGKEKIDRDYEVRVDRKSPGPGKQKFKKKRKKGDPHDEYHDVPLADTWEAFVEYEHEDQPLALVGRKFPLVDASGEIYGVVIVFDAEELDAFGKPKGSGTFTTPVGIMILYNPL